MPAVLTKANVRKTPMNVSGFAACLCCVWFLYILNVLAQCFVFFLPMFMGLFPGSEYFSTLLFYGNQGFMMSIRLR